MVDDSKKLEDKVHSAFLSEDEKEKIQQQVIKELDAENKKQVVADYKATLIKAAKKKALFHDAEEGLNEDGLVPIFISLTSVSECIRIDGKQFSPGHTYNVTPAVRDVILECMGRGREHEESLMDTNAKKNAYRKRTNPTAQF